MQQIVQSSNNKSCTMEAFNLLPDLQTNSGLLIAMAPDGVNEIETLFTQNGLQNHLQPISV